MSDVFAYTLLVIGIAVALDLWLMHRAQRHWEGRRVGNAPGQPEVRLFGRFSPVLTWLKYGRLLSSSQSPSHAPPQQGDTAYASASARPEHEATSPPAQPVESDRLALIPAPPNDLQDVPTTSIPPEPPAIEIDFRIRIRLPQTIGWPGWLVATKRTTAVRSAWGVRDLDRAELVLGAMGLAAVGQILVLYRQFTWGITAYVAAAAAIILWTYLHPASRDRLTTVATLSRRTEIWLVIVIVALAAFARYYRLDQRIYGVDGDEKSWTLQSYFSVVRNEYRGEFADRHFHYLPVTFYLQGWAMQLFGISLLTPRYVNATMSLLALLLFYWLLRRAAGPPIALTGTLLAAFAFIELSASRQAVHDTLVEFWVLLAYFVSMEAIHRRDGRWFLAAGIAAAVGMLTYETFYLAPVVMLFYLIVCLLRDRKNWQEWAQFILIFLLPLVFVMPSTAEYIRSRQGYHLSAMRNQTNAATFVITRLVESLSTLFYAVRYPDQLVRWGGGPIYNIWLLPFFVIGLIYSLAASRTSHTTFLVLWFVIHYLPFALLGAPLPRVYYPAMTAASGLAAIGLIATLKAIRQRFPGLRSPALLTGFLIALIAVVSYDLNVFSTKLADPAEQQKRRELADVVRASASQAPVTFLSYVPMAGDTIEIEQNLAEFSVAGARGPSRPTDYYVLVELGNLLGRLWDERTNHSTVNVVVDKTATNDPHRAQRGTILNTLRWCYPHTRIQAGRFFDVYQVAAEDLQKPVCHSTNTLTPLRPDRGDSLPAGQPLTFEWRTDSMPRTFRLVIEQRNPQLLWLEAESHFRQDRGWFREAKFAADYAGAGYLADNWRAGPAVAEVNVTQAGKFRLWVRTYRRVVDDQHTFIAMDAQAPVEIATTQTALNTWVWETTGDWRLEPGPHRVTLSRTYGTDPHRSIFIDAVVLSADPAFDPNSHFPWTVALDTGQQPAIKSYTLPQGLPPGQYRWRVEVYDDERLVNGLGQPGVSTPSREFSVTADGAPSG